jgi:hypothetical protein
MIHIVDNFLDEKDFNDLKAFSKSKNVIYSPQYFENSTDKTDKNTYGFRYEFLINSELGQCLSKQCLKKFKYKIEKTSICGIDKRKLTMFKPHTDDGLAKINFYLQIDGGTKLNHGLGIYTDNKLDIHIGFRENRAVLFNSDLLHSPLVDEEIWRTTLTMFITEGYFI